MITYFFHIIIMERELDTCPNQCYYFCKLSHEIGMEFCDVPNFISMMISYGMLLLPSINLATDLGSKIKRSNCIACITVILLPFQPRRLPIKTLLETTSLSSLPLIRRHNQTLSRSHRYGTHSPPHLGLLSPSSMAPMARKPCESLYHSSS